MGIQRSAQNQMHAGRTSHAEDVIVASEVDGGLVTGYNLLLTITVESVFDSPTSRPAAP